MCNRGTIEKITPILGPYRRQNILLPKHIPARKKVTLKIKSFKDLKVFLPKKDGCCILLVCKVPFHFHPISRRVMRPTPLDRTFPVDSETCP